MTSWWWGMDPSTWRIAMAGRSSALQTEHLYVDVPKKLRGGERLAAIRHTAGVAARMMAERTGLPVAVQVEQPFAFGHNVEPALYYAIGCAQAGVWSALQGLVVAAGAGSFELETADAAIVVDDVQPAHARKVAMQNGAAKKSHMLEWALRCEGVGTLTQDEADAIVVAECCRLEHPVDDGLVLREAPAV